MLYRLGGETFKRIPGSACAIANKDAIRLIGENGNRLAIGCFASSIRDHPSNRIPPFSSEVRLEVSNERRPPNLTQPSLEFRTGRNSFRVFCGRLIK